MLLALLLSTLTQPTDGFRFFVPDGWTAISGGTRTRIAFAAPDRHAVFEVQMIDGSFALTTVGLAIVKLNLSANNLRFTGESMTRLGDVTVARLVAEKKQGDTKALIYVVPGAEKIACLIYWTGKARFGELTPAFDAAALQTVGGKQPQELTMSMDGWQEGLWTAAGAFVALGVIVAVLLVKRTRKPA